MPEHGCLDGFQYELNGSSYLLFIIIVRIEISASLCQSVQAGGILTEEEEEEVNSYGLFLDKTLSKT